MPRYFALLGSINVGGNRIKMADLKAALAEDGFADLVTVAASGNVIFSDDRPAEELETALEKLLGERFGFSSCAIVRKKEHVEAAIEANPFHGAGPDYGEDRFVHCVFLKGQPDQVQFDTLLADHCGRGNERIALGDRVLFLDYVDGVGVSILTNQFLERRLGCKGTARNMSSLKNILSKMD